jgi:hypothetical protein
VGAEPSHTVTGVKIILFKLKINKFTFINPWTSRIKPCIGLITMVTRQQVI